MANLTLQQLFGSGASQTATTITIVKSNLPGLTPSTTNRAESLLVALILQAWSEFEGLIVDESEDTLIDESGIAIGYDQSGLYDKLNLWFWKRQYVNGNTRDSFIVNAFVNSSVAYGTPLNVNLL